MSHKLNSRSKKTLLLIARDSIVSKLTDSPKTVYTINEELQKSGGVFVTIYLSGEIRGCVGLIESSFSLSESVHELAIQAALHDPRFPALTINEIPSIDIKVSILTKPQPIVDSQLIRIGTDGIILQNNNNRALFLPQVPQEHGWNLETTLNFLSTKAGMNDIEWKSPASKFSVFQAEHFDESEFKLQRV